MNRIDCLFNTKKNRILSVYCTAGYPCLNSTVTVIKTLSEQGVDMIEIGIPFSDPVADGPVIQQSNTVALKNGMTLALLLEQLKEIRTVTSVPLILMGYLNPILQYGMEALLKQAKACGIDGLIIPDLPLREYEQAYQSLFAQYGIAMIFLITPQTAPERIREIDRLSTGFVYMVTAASTTGRQSSFTTQQTHYFEAIQKMDLRNPVLAGFGIHDHTGFHTVCQYVQGAIVGSGFIKAIATGGDAALQDTIPHFIKSLYS
ncbi:tryptophan synthase subunit alpha [Taibaiella sp. KBW10]|nr:tryptophan synthase subunit alpha [Taibaiella sp. KBW10]